MQTKFIARKIKQYEWLKYKTIRLEALKNDPQAFGSSYEQEIQKSDNEWKKEFTLSNADDSKKIFVCIDKNSNEFLAIEGAYAENDLGEWNIIAVYVDPNYRGQGIGKILLSKIISILKDREDIKKLVLRVNMNQRAAINLYRSLGFAIINKVEKQPLGDGNFYDEFEMALDLKN